MYIAIVTNVVVLAMVVIAGGAVVVCITVIAIGIMCLQQ
jgi:hypothetical protein